MFGKEELRSSFRQFFKAQLYLIKLSPLLILNSAAPSKLGNIRILKLYVALLESFIKFPTVVLEFSLVYAYIFYRINIISAADQNNPRVRS